MKKNKLIISILLLVAIFFTSCNKDVGPLGQRIMDEIDQKIDSYNECIIDIKELTNFEWDKMVAVDAICTSEELTKALGFNYKRSNGFKDELLFFKDGDVIYKESYIASVEEAVKFALIFNNLGYFCRVFTPEDAKFLGQRFDNNKLKWHYVLVIEDNNENSGD